MNYILLRFIKLSSYVAARYEEYFPDSFKFRPERFSNENNRFYFGS